MVIVLSSNMTTTGQYNKCAGDRASCQELKEFERFGREEQLEFLRRPASNSTKQLQAVIKQNGYTIDSGGSEFFTLLFPSFENKCFFAVFSRMWKIFKKVDIV